MKDRFSAQTGLIGEEGQERLNNASVLVVGAGGLGAPVIQYLAAAGVGYEGRLAIADGDKVELSNLNRQVLFKVSDVESEYNNKAVLAAKRARNRDVIAQALPARLTGKNLRICMTDGIDLVVAAVDNMETRLEINDIGVQEDIPVIHGACSGWHGQVMVSRGRAGPCYRCVFGEEADERTERAGMEKGIMGTTCGIVGSFMAQEAIKILLAHEKGTEFLQIDCYYHRVTAIGINPEPDCKAGSHGDTT